MNLNGPLKRYLLSLSHAEGISMVNARETSNHRFQTVVSGRPPFSLYFL